jgi:hypothetical protein
MAYDASLGYDPNFDYAKAINTASASNNDSEVERLALERYKKINSSPDLLAQYGNDAYSSVAKAALQKQQTPIISQTDTGVGVAQTDTGVGVAQPVVQAQSFSDVMSWIDTLTAAQKSNAIAGVTNARDSALSSLSAEKSTIAPLYYNQRNQLSAAGATGSQAMNEYLAQNGLSGSGASGELQSRIGTATQGNIAASQTSESQAIADILRRTTDVNNQYQQGVASANSAADIARIQNLISQANSDRQYELQTAPYTGMLNGSPTVQAQATEREVSDAALQRQIDSIAQYGNDYAKEINNRTNSADTADDALIPYLTIARNAKIAAQQSAQSENAQETYKQAFDTFKTLGVASGWVASALGIPEGSQSANYMQMLYNVSRPYSNGSSGASSSQASIPQLISLWKTSGVAPAGLESYNILPGTPLPRDPQEVDTIKISAANKEISDILAIGGSEETGMSGTVDRAYTRLEELVDSGALLEEDADIIVENNPALRAYVSAKVTAANGRTASQTR